MNSIWNKNLISFTKRFPQLADIMALSTLSEEQLCLEQLVPQWQISQAKNGQLTVSEDSVRLHSAYNPQREAGGAVTAQEVAQKTTTVFYGFGIGYHLVEWARTYGKDSSKKLVVIEPDVNRFIASMVCLDWTEIFTIENLVLAAGCSAETVLQLIENPKAVNIGETGVSDAFYFDIPAFTRHAQNYFDAVKSIIKRNQRKNEINAATLKKFGKLWCKNSLKNLEQMGKLGGISALKNSAHKDMPFLIIGAGPSLEKVLPYLQELKNKAVIVCVETALRACLRVDVEPDFVILTDPQFWAYKHIAGLAAPSSTLITEISTYPAVFRFNCKNILLCSSQFPIGQYFEQELGLDFGDLGTGGSVASSAWNFAWYCGAKKIYVAGLDLAFPKKQTHIKGSAAEQTYHSVANRLQASDKFTASALFSANAVMSRDYTGAPVLTDSRMKMFSWWFESRLAACPEVQTFTVSPEGLNTPGIQPVKLETLMNCPDCGEQKAWFMSRATTVENCTFGNKGAATLGELKSSFPDKEFIEKYPFLKPYL